MDAIKYLKGLDVNNPVWDVSEEYEYTQEQLIHFAEEYNRAKLKAFADWLQSDTANLNYDFRDLVDEYLNT